MLLELILLALVTAIGPTSLAAAFALVADAQPRRLMLAYVVAGLAFTVTFGALVIWAFDGFDIESGTDEAKGIAEIVGGDVALGFGLSPAGCH